MKYVEKPKEVEAIQVTERTEFLRLIERFNSPGVIVEVDGVSFDSIDLIFYDLRVHNRSGTATIAAYPYDYLVKEWTGYQYQVYTMSEQEFERRFEPKEETVPTEKLGIISIDGDLCKDQIGLMQEIFGWLGMVPVDVQQDGYDQTIKVKGICDKFDPIVPEEKVPEYTVWILNSDEDYDFRLRRK